MKAVDVKAARSGASPRIVHVTIFSSPLLTAAKQVVFHVNYYLRQGLHSSHSAVEATLGILVRRLCGRVLAVKALDRRMAIDRQQLHYRRRLVQAPLGRLPGLLC